MRNRKRMHFLKKRNESIDETRNLIEVAKRGARNAVRASRALGLTVKYISNGTIIEKDANGTVRAIRKVKASYIPQDGKMPLKKGTVLCRK